MLAQTEPAIQDKWHSIKKMRGGRLSNRIAGRRRRPRTFRRIDAACFWSNSG